MGYDPKKDHNGWLIEPVYDPAKTTTDDEVLMVLGLGLVVGIVVGLLIGWFVF